LVQPVLDCQKFAERVPAWLMPEGDSADVVASCRIRLARNLRDFPFAAKLSAERAVELCDKLEPELTALPVGSEMQWVEMSEVSQILRLLLRERHLVSRDLAPSNPDRAVLPGRAVAFSRDETLSVMVNEEDHLRVQCMAGGLDLEELWRRARELDLALEQRLEYAYDHQYGYLTCCPTNVGTGLRASVMLHLPALGMVRSELEKVFTAAQRTGLAVRGLYGEGSRAVGDYYQISNQVTLGRAESDLVAELSELVPAIVRFERSLRDELSREQRAALVDRVSRSFGLLRTARAMPSDGALAHLSNLRLGSYLGLWSQVSLKELSRIRVQIQKAHVQALTEGEGTGELIDASQRDRARAAYLRRAVSSR
jgi:protein arginine kinase